MCRIATSVGSAEIPVKLRIGQAVHRRDRAAHPAWVKTGHIEPGPQVSQAAKHGLVQPRTPGVLKLTLSDAGYSWAFIPIAGRAFTDSGNGACH